MTAFPVVRLEQVSVRYQVGSESVLGLDGATIDIAPGSSMSVVGRSGSGKSTLVSVMSLLRRPTSGKVLVDGHDVMAMSDAHLARLRARSVGTVFQSYHLDDAFSAMDNVMTPWYFGSPLTRRQARDRAASLLELLGMADLTRRRPSEMSGGQRQRVAIARALFSGPRLLLADEPTGNLDEATAGVIADVLFSLPSQMGTAVVVVTHDHQVSARAERRTRLVRGNLSEESAEALPSEHGLGRAAGATSDV